MDEPWIELLNSDWHDYMGKSPPQDRLENPQWLQKFLAQWQLSPSVIAAKSTRSSLKELRSLLKQLVLRIIKEHYIRSDELKKLNAYLAVGPFHCQIQQTPQAEHEYQLRFDSVEMNLKSILAHIAKSFAEVLAEGDPARIKLCENPDCRWVFYDESRSRTRRWCEGATGCGNLLKVRRHRARKKKKSRSN